MTDADLRRRGEEAGFTLLASTPAEAEAFAAQEVARWARLITESGIRAE
jgi:tripartite-type tricarboxylate transporter receptor subunit TctC